MTIAEPRWWRYIVMKDVNGVGVVDGFIEGTPQEIIDEYNAYVKYRKRMREEGIRL